MLALPQVPAKYSQEADAVARQDKLCAGQVIHHSHCETSYAVVFFDYPHCSACGNGDPYSSDDYTDIGNVVFSSWSMPVVLP